MADQRIRGDYQNEGSGPLYHEVSPKITLGVRVLGGCTLFMVVLSFIFCLARGSGNNSFYLLACNLIISGFVGAVNTWWYRKGDLGADKYWYIILVAAVIFFQCLTTDIYVFHAVPSQPPTTAIPFITTHHPNITTTHK